MRPRPASLLAVLAVLAPLAAAAAPPLLLTVGEVASDRAIVWLRAGAAGPATLEVHGPDGQPAGRFAVTLSAADDLTARIPVPGLRPRTRYTYRVAAGPASGVGEFVT
ncbi:MAG: hypothetical protein ACREJG_11065, partial [Candidatus Rokuibacteriota bacterium]